MSYMLQQNYLTSQHNTKNQWIILSLLSRGSMVSYFCQHLSDNYFDLSESDLYVDLSVIYVHLPVIYVDLADQYVDLLEKYYQN